MTNPREVRRRSFSYCAETCPNVEGGIYLAFEKFSEENHDLDLLPGALEALARDAFKVAQEEGTLKLRAALEEVVAELIEAEDRIKALEADLEERLQLS